MQRCGKTGCDPSGIGCFLGAGFPRGVAALNPRLRGCEPYGFGDFGSRRDWTPRGICAVGLPAQPVPGWEFSPREPRVAPGSQPWAGWRKPFGIRDAGPRAGAGRELPTRRGRVTGCDPSGIGWFWGRGFPGVSLRSTPGYVAANPTGSGTSPSGGIGRQGGFAPPDFRHNPFRVGIFPRVNPGLLRGRNPGLDGAIPLGLGGFWGGASGGE